MATLDCVGRVVCEAARPLSTLPSCSAIYWRWRSRAAVEADDYTDEFRNLRFQTNGFVKLAGFFNADVERRTLKSRRNRVRSAFSVQSLKVG